MKTSTNQPSLNRKERRILKALERKGETLNQDKLITLAGKRKSFPSELGIVFSGKDAL